LTRIRNVLRERFSVAAVAVSMAVGLFLTARLLASAEGYPLDDSWIHLDYARSLIESATFGHTSGEWENGSTAPLWSVLVALPLAFGAPPELASKLVGLLLLVPLAIFVYRVALRLGGRPAAMIGASVVVLDPWTQVLAVSGMETVAAMTAGLAAIDAALGRRALRAGMALAAAGLLRPELGVLVPLVGSVWLLDRGTARRRWLELLGPPAVTGAIWVTYGLVVTGLPLPNTFWVKTDTGEALSAQLDALRALYFSGPVAAVAIVVLLMALGMSRVRPRNIAIVVLPPLVLIGFLLLAVPLGGPYGPMAAGSSENVYFARYSLLIVPWLVLWLALGCASLFALVEQLAARRFPARTARTLAALPLLVLAAFVLPSWQGHRSVLTKAYEANTNEIQRVQVRMAREMDSNLPPDAVVGVSDAGALRFFSRQRIIDLCGLNTHEMIRSEDPVGWLVDQGLTHLVIWPGWHAELLDDSRLVTRSLGSVRVGHPTMVPAPALMVYGVTEPVTSAP